MGFLWGHVFLKNQALHFGLLCQDAQPITMKEPQPCPWRGYYSEGSERPQPQFTRVVIAINFISVVRTFDTFIALTEPTAWDTAITKIYQGFLVAQMVITVFTETWV